MPDLLRIALAHLAPVQGALADNTAAVERALEQAAALGASWVVTPELALTGYDFAGHLGADWIAPVTEDPWIARLHARARAAGVTLFLGHAERDPATRRCHNSVVVLAPEGVLGVHRKCWPLPVIEGWASRGEAPAPIVVEGLAVGVLVCADAWRPEPAAALKARGARLLLSAAAWPPEPHGPEGCWQQRTLDTGLPLFVCNRGGAETNLRFDDAETGVFAGGERRVSFRGDGMLVRVDWSLDEGRVVGASRHALG